MSQRVTISIKYGIAEVQLNRPDKRNALDLDMFQAIAAAQKKVVALLQIQILKGKNQRIAVRRQRGEDIPYQ